jgi:hypothetical protein
MNLREIVTLLQLQGGARLLAVRFVDEKDPSRAKVYNYKCLIDGVNLNDLVVVETYNHMSVAVVVAELPAQAMTGIEYDQLRHVVAKVDLGTYNRILSAERIVKDRMAMAEINERLASVRQSFGDDGLASFRATLLGAPAPAQEAPTEELPA